MTDEWVGWVEWTEWGVEDKVGQRSGGELKVGLEEENWTIKAKKINVGKNITLKTIKIKVSSWSSIAFIIREEEGWISLKINANKASTTRRRENKNSKREVRKIENIGLTIDDCC